MKLLAGLLIFLMQLPADPVVAGRVVRAGTNDGITGARVLFTKVDGRLTDSIVATTDDLGKFALNSIPAGTYRLFANHEDYVRTEHTGRLTVVSGGRIQDVVLAMPAVSIITGRVVDSDNEPVSRVYVRASAALGRVYEAQTNDLGEYRIYGIPAGMYLLSAARYPGPRIEETSYVVPTPPGLDSRGEGRFSSALSNLLSSGGFIDPRALTNSQSQTVYYPSGSEARPIEIQPGATLRGIDFRM
jgi:hypothetical protein